MNLRDTNFDSTLIRLSKAAEVLFIVAIVFALVSLVRVVLLLPNIEL
jgi:hypothetical protein